VVWSNSDSTPCGELTDRNDRTQSRVITEHKNYNFLATLDIEVTNLAFTNDDVIWISWKHSAEERVPNLRHTIEVLGPYLPQVPGFICIAISTVWEREPSMAAAILSFTFSRETKRDLLKQGDKLGDMTCELRPTDYVSEFVSGGPKNYAYKINDTVTVRASIFCKVCGITLNYSAKQ